MNEYIDFYVPIIDNYGDIGFALNLALIMTSKNHKLKVRFFSNDEKLFDKMVGSKIQNTEYRMQEKYNSKGLQNKNNIIFHYLFDLQNHIPPKNIFTFFDYKLPSEYLKKGEKGKTIIQFGYFLLHKGIENLHNTTYEIEGNKFIHFIPSLREKTGGIIINKVKDKSLKTKDNYLNYLNTKYNLGLPSNFINKKWISVFVYKDTLNEIIEVIQERKDEIFFMFDSGKRIQNVECRIQKEKNIIFMPFLELLDYNDFLSVCDINIVRGENSLCTSLSSGKITLWDIYKENNEAHNEKINDFLIFLEENKIQKWKYNETLNQFNNTQKKEAFTDFLDNADNYKYSFKNLGNYINNNCDLYKNLKIILKN